jgi:hypothetical protein
MSDHQLQLERRTESTAPLGVDAEPRGAIFAGTLAKALPAMRHVLQDMHVSGQFSEAMRKGSQFDFIERLFRAAGSAASMKRGGQSFLRASVGLRFLHGTLRDAVLLAQASGELTSAASHELIADELMLEFVQHVAASTDGEWTDSLERAVAKLQSLFV